MLRYPLEEAGRRYPPEAGREDISTSGGEGGDIHQGRGGQGYQDISCMIGRGAY